MYLRATLTTHDKVRRVTPAVSFNAHSVCLGYRPLGALEGEGLSPKVAGAEGEGRLVLASR